jgi:DNA-binding beta-propeller fold protein YncE
MVFLRRFLPWEYAVNAKSRRPLFLTLLAVVLAAVIGGLTIPLYTAPARSTDSVSSQASSTQSQASSTSSGSFLTLSRTVPLPSTVGRIDHMAVDLSRGLLFVACYANDTVGIVDLKSGHVLRSIGGLSNPQGVAWVPDAGKLFVSNAGDGTVAIFDGNSFAQVGRVSLAGDADNLRFDAGTKLLYVGFGSGGIAAINTTTGSVVSTRALPAHPESFQIEAHGRVAYANVPPSNLVVAFDKVSGSSISNRSMTGSNFPMAIDEAGGRLFVGTRNPPELRVLDTSTASLRSVANLTIAGDPDDIFYDAARGAVYVSCGQGSLEVFKQIDANHYGLLQTVATGAGARTSLLVPELGSIYVAVPAGSGQPAEILVFGVGSAVLSSTSSSSTSIAPIPTSATLSVSPGSGPSGLFVTFSGSGYFPGARYQVCVGGYGNSSCGFEYTSAAYTTTIDEIATLGNFTADPAGNIPAGTRMAIPDLFGRGYSLGVVRDGESSFFVSAPFTVEAPSLSMGAVTLPARANVTLTGSGYAPSTNYTVCMVPVGTVDCGYTGDREETPPGIYIGTFTADANGDIPSGTKVTIPLLPPGQESIGVFMPGHGFILITQVDFTLTAG